MRRLFVNSPTNLFKYLRIVAVLVSIAVLAKVSLYQQYSYAISNASVQSVTPQVLASFDSSDIIAKGLPSADAVFDIVNSKRVANNLQPLIRNSTLTKLAVERANDMVARKYYAHKNPDGLFYYDLLDQQKYTTGYSCENLDLSFEIGPEDYVADWMNSSHGHRECLLNDRITDAGYALVSYTSSVESSGVDSYLVVAIHAEL